MKQKTEVSKTLTEGSIWRHLISISFPAMVGFFFNSLYTWVDTFWAGRLSDTALAATSITFPLFLFGIAVAQCIAVGAMIMISNSIGAKKEKESKIYLEQGISISIIFGLGTMILFFIIAKSILALLGAQGEVLTQGVQYIKYLALGMPFLSMTFVANSGLTSRGNTKFMRNIFILNTAINIWLDPLLMYGIKIGNVTIIPEMGVRGLALATVFVQALGALLLFFKLKKESCLRISFKHYHLKKNRIFEIIKYGFPAALQVGLVSVGLSIINFFLYKLGDSNVIAGYGIGLRIEQMALIPSFGVSIALSALVGQNNGAQKFERVQKTLYSSLIMAVVILVAVMAPVSFLGKFIVQLFSNTAAVVDVSVLYLRFALIAFYGYQIMFLSSSTLQGMKFPNIPIYIALGRQLVLPWLLIPLFAYVFGLGINGVFLSVIFSAWIPAVVIILITLKLIRQKIKEQCMHAEDVALLIVDIQNDFLPPYGALKVAQGDSIIDGINNRAKYYKTAIATKDFHPKGHKSFASSHDVAIGSNLALNGNIQIMWPDHCVQGTPGSDLSTALDKKKVKHVIEKGTDLNIDSYSAFFDNDKKKQTGLNSLLKKKGIIEIHICGLATDYCVKFSVLDALKLGYKVKVIRNLSRAVNLEIDDEEKAIEEMREAGAQIEI